ncbi:MAG: hypothetical protein HC906_00680 [Bacteroidales bacterium]|nr:hypothetical protein [Bacteroidales bacterium]
MNTKISILFAFLILSTSCDDYLDVNIDPDAIQENPGIFIAFHSGIRW